MYSWGNIEKIWGTVVMKKHPEKTLWMFFSASLHLIDAHTRLISFPHLLKMARLNLLQQIS